MINRMGGKAEGFTGSWRFSIRVWVILLAMGLMGLTACSTTEQNSISRRDHAAALQTEIAKQVAREIEFTIIDRAKALQLIIQVSDFGNLPEADQRLLFSKILLFDDTFDELALLDNNGQEVIRESRREIVTDSDLQNRSNQPEFTSVIETQAVYFGPVILDPVSSEPLMTISFPIVDLRTEQLTYVLVGQFRFRTISDVIQARDLSQGQDIYLVDGDSRVVAHSNPAVMLRDTRFETQDRDKVTTGLLGDPVVIGLARFTVGAQEFTTVAELTTTVADK